MGALQSIREILPDVKEKDSFENEKSTPVRPVNKRLLSLDPRSPSETIQRTPIIVEKTPVPDSSRNAAHHTPVSTSRVQDPRSPSTDFTRTPINPCLATEPERQISRLQPAALDSLPSTTTVGSESGIESAEVTPVKDTLPGQGLESPDSAFSADEAISDGHVATSEAGSAASRATDDHENVRAPLVAETTAGVRAEDTPKLPALRARPQALSKLSKLAVEGSKLSDSLTVTRSPLSNVANARTALGLQQNKARPSPAGGQPIGRSVVPTGADKENCFR